MADRRAKAAPDVTKPQALVGSAAILKASRVNAPRNVAWQVEAWGMWRSTPEPSFAANWLGHGFSLCRLYAAKRPQSPGDEPEPIKSGPAVDLVAQLGGGLVGQQQLLHSFGVHMTVPGIGYLTGQQGASAFDSWQVLSADELRVQGRGYEVMVGEQQWEKCPPETLVVKCWRPDEQFHFRPWSPMQSVLPVLRELDGLSKKIDADIVSRLASAGIILIPSEVEFPVRPEFADADDPLMAEIIEVVSTAIRDRASAAANVPVFIRVPGEYVDKIKHLTWTTALDEMSIKLREEARGRFAVGMDMPAEVLTGLGSIQHWGQWFLDEQGIKYHIRPGLAAVCQGITLGYLTPGLDALGQSDPEAMIWYDASELTTRPDLSANMQALYDRLEVNGRSLRRETGADESDKPDATELAEMAFKAMLKDPALVAIGLAGLGLPVPDIALNGAAPLAPAVPVEEAPADAQPINGPPVTPEDANPPPPGLAASSAPAVDQALVAAADGLVCRALEKAGNQARRKVQPKKGAANDCPPMLMHECLGGITACGLEVGPLLAGAWERVPDIAGRLHVDPVWLTQSLELYAAGLLDTGRAHTWENLEAFLAGEMALA